MPARWRNRAAASPGSNGLQRPFGAGGDAMPGTAISAEAGYAGFWRGFAAPLIDALILAALVALGHSVGLASVTTYVGGGEATVEFGEGPLLLAAAYTLVFWATLQATPGKLAVGVRIVDAASGGKPSLKQLAGRYLAYYVSLIPCFLGLPLGRFRSPQAGLAR